MQTWCGFSSLSNKIACPIMLDRHKCFMLVTEFGAKKVDEASKILTNGAAVVEVRAFIINGGLCPEA